MGQKIHDLLDIHANIFACHSDLILAVQCPAAEGNINPLTIPAGNMADNATGFLKRNRHGNFKQTGYRLRISGDS
jgi:hypothetical protein